MSKAWIESPLLFPCGEETLLGIHAQPEASREVGVLFLIGGDQYRIGSQRQFVRWARAFSEAGYPTLRFDVRGMGDSTGEPADFTEQGPDILAAVQAWQAANPALRRWVVMGLCDGASSALLQLPSLMSGLAGYVLMNPWVETPALQEAVQVRHYYLQRVCSVAFWRKLLSGEVALGASLGEFVGKCWRLFFADQSPVPVAETLPYPARMAKAWKMASVAKVPMALLLSGQDYTAKSFLLHVSQDEYWQGCLSVAELSRYDFPAADHTFSTPGAWQAVTDTVLTWMAKEIP